ncbi:MAG: ABC transporter ATP-binding protein [Myxococcales bacterium]|nr:ABC transporter ATP-binding protein [Myxococcales bacterium]
MSLEELTKDFGALRAVDRLSLEVRPGEVVGLLGPNGAGKTTALRVLAGLLAPTSGRALLLGFDVTERPLQARRQLGFLTASTGLYERLTVKEVLSTFGRLHGMAEVAITGRLAQLSAELELSEFLDRRCGSLSTGQKQRVSIARAVLHEPAVYVLDEPTASLDPLASSGILEMVRRARGAGKAVLFSTHRMEEAEFLCDRLVFLAAGKAVAEGTPAELRHRSGEPSLTGAFLHYAKLGARS